MDLVHTDQFINQPSIDYFVLIQQNESVVVYLIGVIPYDILDE